MAYIGNAKTPLLLASNVRDDLIPGSIVNGVCTKTTFSLSQEVPGGEESNVTVVRRRFLSDTLIENSDLVTITTTSSTTIISTTDNYLAAALSVVQPKSTNYEGDDLKIKANNITLNATVIRTSYTRDAIEIEVDKVLDFGTEAAVSLHKRSYGAWEILDPKTDYRISGQFGTASYNKEIVLTEAPQISDLIYVLHRGDATYNFVPSPYSVGIDQLSNNLKNFMCDRYTADGDTDSFSLSQNAVNEKALLVTVDGIVSEGDDLAQEFVGDWKLVQNTTNSTQTIQFHPLKVPANNAKVRILHLGFVAGLRRAAFAPGQEPTEIKYRSVTDEKLADDSVITRTILNSSVSTSKLQDSSVTAPKILLTASQNDGLRISYPDGIKRLIGANFTTDSQIDTQVYTKTNFLVKSDQQDLLTVSSSSVTPGVTGTTSLGTSTNKFSNLHLSGSASVGSSLSVAQGATIAGATQITGETNIVGNTTVNGVVNVSAVGEQSALNVVGNISVSGTVDTVDVSALYQSFLDLRAKVSSLIPVGTIMASGRTAIDTTDGVWLVCDGTQKNRYEFSELFDAIGYTFGGSGEFFLLPDLSRRVPVGKSASDVVGDNEGSTVENRSLTHSHISAEHTHNLSNHTHSVPGHKHSITTNSTLRIESTTLKPSGGHTTNISHGHGSNTTTTSAWNLANTAGNTFSHTHGFSHQHTGQTTEAGGVDHYHAASTTSDGAHSHTLPVSNFQKILYGATSANDYYAARSTTDSAVGGAGGHSHSISIGWALNPANPYGNGFSHVHTFATSPHSGTTAGPDASNNTLDHIHRFTVPTFTGTSSNPAGGTDGAHGHLADTFTGTIGDDTATVSNGNSSFATGVPSTNATGAAIYSNTNTTGATGETKTPYMILNFIIKAKNS